MKILLADDSQPIRTRMAARLKDIDGVILAEAVDTPDALRQIKEFLPDVAVLDIRMPGGGGIKALSAIKKDFPDVTVIIMTNYPYAQYRRKCLEAGADFFFDKSTEFEQVPRVVERIVAGESVSALGHQVVGQQLAVAKEELERVDQKRRDLGILSVLTRSASSRRAENDSAYDMWGETFDAIPDMVAILDTKHSIVRVNQAMANRLGVPATELTGKTCCEFMHGLKSPVSGCPHKALLHDSKPHQSEFFDEHLQAWLNVSVSPIIKDHKLVGAVHVARDVTVRREAEKALRQQENELLHVVDMVSDGLWDWDIVHDKVTCSAQWYQMLGYVPGAFPMSYEKLEELTHPEDVPKIEEAVRAYFSGETERYEVEIRMRREDRSYAKVWARGSLVERTPEGDPARMMGFHADVSKEREVEEALRESEQRYRQLFASMHAGFALHQMIYDKNGSPCDYRFIEVNPAFEKMTGLKEADVVGRRVREILPTTEDHWIEAYGQVDQTGEPALVTEFSGALGRYYSVAAYSPRKGQVATVIQDITQQKEGEALVRKARDDAQAANESKTRFLANMSHELRTPLNAIIGMAELMEDTPLSDEQEDYVRTIENSSESLLALISDLLDFSKLEMGKMRVLNENVSVRRVVQKSMDLLAPVACSKDVSLEFDYQEGMKDEVLADEDRLQQVFINLINNALKFTEEGFVRVRLAQAQVPTGSHCVMLRVEDSGCGMDEETVTRIFDPFQQGDNSLTRQHGGTGLGLAISKELVEAMGGTISVSSEPGKGSTFVVSFTTSPPTEHSVSEEMLRSRWSGRRVFVWDDNPADLRSIEYCLERIGCSLCCCETLSSICTCTEQVSPPEVVLCNLEMKGLRERLPEFKGSQPNVLWIGMSDWHAELDDEGKEFFAGFVDRPIRRDQFYRALDECSLGK